MSNPIPNYVLDSFALIAYFQNEIGGLKVKTLLEKTLNSEIFIYMSIINVAEVYYITSRHMGDITARSLLDDIRRLPITIHSVTDDDIMHAAKLKAQYSASFCDAFAASLAHALQAPVITGDREFHEFEDIIQIEWLA